MRVIWRHVKRGDSVARTVADTHYNRQSIGAAMFTPPGRALVLTTDGPSLWVTSWPFAEYTKHRWAGAWVCSAFKRHASDPAASEMIRQAVAATRAHYGDPPDLGMVTFIDRTKVPPLHTRKGDVWGYTYRRAGFVEAGETEGGLLALQLLPEAMPAPELALGGQVGLFDGVTAPEQE